MPVQPMIIDSHAHYSHNRFDQTFRCLVNRNGVFSIEEATREAVLDNLKDSGFAASVEPAIGIDSNKKVFDLAKRYKGFILPAYGCHPTRTCLMKFKDRRIISEYASTGCVAIGETGLDYHHARRDQHRMIQKRWFRYQIRLAYVLGKPLILHIRSAAKDALTILRKKRKYLIGGVAHCFCDDLTIAQAYIELGLHIGIGAALLTDECGDRLTEVIENIPLDRIVVETDAPFMMPDLDIYPSKKQKYKIRNTSTTINAVIERIAQIKKLSTAEVERSVYDNTVKLFRLEGQSASAK